ncbi:MAG TPA: hypothetical protein VMR50_00595 [Myxococcota bacterium]|nr:hypothetical protein [Myxococcota bacterium]
MTPREAIMFAIEEGGPAWRLWLQLGLAPSDPKPLVRRALVLSALCWIPLLVLTLRDGLATGESVRVPFLSDFAAYARFLISVTLLVLSDAFASGRFRQVLRQFYAERLVGDASESQFVEAIATARRRMNSVWSELFVLALVVFGCWSAAERELGNGTATWQGLLGPDGKSFTAAGWWAAVVSVPIFQFVFLRWLFRGVLWALLLARIARLDLRLVPTHPDRAGGLGFLATGQGGFAMLILAASVSLSAVLADDVVYRGIALEATYPVIASFGVVALVFVLGPLFAFAPRLAKLKREALHQYSALSARHDHAFQEKWLRDDAAAESLLGEPDASSLTDLASGGYDRVKALRPIPIDIQAIVPVLFAAALPMIPLIATKVPLNEILKGLMRIVM